MNKTSVFLIAAAGGNATAISVLDAPLSREVYAEKGKTLLSDLREKGAEQVGFLIPSENRFEMAGGEFCGNAARSAALLLSSINKTPTVSFSMSGVDGRVLGTVLKLTETTYQVTCVFPNFKLTTRKATLASETEVQISDMGSIVYVLIQGPFPGLDTSLHSAIRAELQLETYPAVGVVWYGKDGRGVSMHPVVWVRDMDSFVYEQSCGSGAIAVAKETGSEKIYQPTGQNILVREEGGAISLESEMEILNI